MPGFMEFSNDLGIYYHKWCQFIKKNFKNYAIFKVHVDFNRSYRFYFYNSRFFLKIIILYFDKKHFFCFSFEKMARKGPDEMPETIENTTKKGLQ